MTRVITLFFGVLLCFSITYAQEQFEHSLWEWVQGSEISDKELYKVAPHFPFPNEYNYDVESYDNAIFKWQKLYCFEYEKLINTPALTKLNPYYDGYQDIIQLPYFILPLESKEKPQRPKNFASFEDEVNYELKEQAWYFVFQPEEFYQKYRIEVEFPTWFDEEVYRNSVIEKIEATKKAKENGFQPDYPEESN